MQVLDAGHPVVTVLMPVFNGQDHLREAVDSILWQTFNSFELLVVNDGSTDESADILAGYAAKDERVRVVYQPNSGIVAALNAGLALAKGAYIARMDADDVAHPRRLEIQVAYMETHPNCVACGSDYELIGAKRGHVKTPYTNDECKAQLLLKSCFAHPTVILRSSIFRSAGLHYEDEFQFAEDYRLWTQLAQYGDLANIPEPLISYRVHSGQLSSLKKQLQRQRHVTTASDYLSQHGIAIDKSDIHKILWGDIEFGKKICTFINILSKSTNKIKLAPYNTTRIRREMYALALKNIIKNAIEKLTANLRQ